MQEYLRVALDDSLGARYVAAHAQTADVVVEAIDNREENTRRLVAIGVDSVRISTTENIRAALGETLYEFVTARKRYEYDVNRTSQDERLCSVLWRPAERVRVSLNQQYVQISPSFAVIDELGNNEILMPWWQYGMFRIGVAHENFRFMFQGPFTPGLQKTLFIEPRHIDGAFGGAFQFHVENWSGEVAYATMTKQTSLDNVFIYPPYFNYVSMIAQVRYAIAVSAGGLGSLELTFGGGMHKIQHDSLGSAPQNSFYEAANQPALIVSPILQVAYVSLHDDVELIGQYYHSTLMFSGALHLGGAFWISGCAVMIKALRTPESYEPANFFFVSPEIRL